MTGVSRSGAGQGLISDPLRRPIRMSSDPIQTPPTSQCRDMVRLHFAECSQITEIWSEVSRRPAGAPGAIGIISLTARVVCEKRSAMSQHNDRSDDPTPVIEPGRDGAEHVELTTRALHLRIRQQEILAELGVLALQGTPFLELLNQTARLTAEGMEAEFCKVLEYIPAQNRLLVRAGVGWHEGIVGVATVGADLESPSGFALRTGKPVISNHLENEQRFRTPELLVEHGIRRAMNVILQGDGSPYGVLEVDSRSEGEFAEHDIAFLQGAANILGMAIERQRYERQLKTALDRHQVLLKEISHRVKNSLQIVSGMLHLQASSVHDLSLIHI